MVIHYRHIDDPDKWENGIRFLCSLVSEEDWSSEAYNNHDYTYINEGHCAEATCEACALLGAIQPELIHIK